MMLQDKVIKESCNFMSGSPSRKVIFLPRLVPLDTVVRDHAFMTSMVGASHGKSLRNPPSLVAIRIVVVEICLVVVEQDTFCSLKSAIIIYFENTYHGNMWARHVGKSGIGNTQLD